MADLVENMGHRFTPALAVHILKRAKVYVTESQVDQKAL